MIMVFPPVFKLNLKLSSKYHIHYTSMTKMFLVCPPVQYSKIHINILDSLDYYSVGTYLKSRCLFFYLHCNIVDLLHLFLQEKEPTVVTSMALTIVLSNI